MTDLKPENIFIVKDSEAAGGERAKILDFGIARLEDPSGEGRRTTAGVAIGTPTYMAPEQCEGSTTINDRVDVYALGVMSFELLTGAPPFVSDSMAAVLRMHIVRPPPPLPVNIPTELAALITQMLGKEAKERPSMAEVVTRLEGLFGGRASSTALPKLTKRPGMTISPAVIGAVATLLVLGIGGLLLTLLGRKPVTPVAPPKVTSTKAVEPSPPKQDPVVEPAKSREPVEPIKESTTKPVAATGPSGKGTKSRKSDKGDGNVMVFETKKKPKKGNAQ